MTTGKFVVRIGRDIISQTGNSGNLNFTGFAGTYTFTGNIDGGNNTGWSFVAFDPTVASGFFI
jgi:hypothetical protein